MLWNFQCVKCLDKHVKQDDGRKEGVKTLERTCEAEFQKKFRKKLACLQSGESFRGFGLDCPSVF